MPYKDKARLREYQREWTNKKQHMRRDNGKCALCGDDSDGWRCDKCKELQSKSSKASAIRNKSKGLCRTCGNPTTDAKARCTECNKKMGEAKRAWMETMREQGRCERCGGYKDDPSLTYCAMCATKKSRSKVR